MNSNLNALGWTPSFQHHFETLADPAAIPARVVRQNREQYILNTGDQEWKARLSGSFRRRVASETDFPTVGDWVTLRLDPSGDTQTISGLLPRKSRFARQAAGKASSHQLAAANFDSLFLVSGLDGDLNLRRIQRYLSLARNSETVPVVVLNKADLCSDPELVVERVRKMGGDIPVHAVSARNPNTLACLSDYLGFGRTVALLGSSGVGKSTLINALLGEARLATQANRVSDSRGKHTTTWRELLILPNGGCLIDLPGMRELQLTGEERGLAETFSDIDEIARTCRFRNCRHQGEPGCAIEAAIAEGALDHDRYLQHVKLSEESQSAKRRHEARRKSAVKSKQTHQEKEQRFKRIMKDRKRNQKAQRKRGQTDGF